MGNYLLLKNTLLLLSQIHLIIYMKHSQITIKDIANALGISASTVSRALKDHPDISTDTKKKVQELAAKLRYRPNAIALSLRNRKSNVIGVIIPQIIHHFFSSVISGIEDVASKAGYQVIICQSNESFQREVNNTFALMMSQVDGVIISQTKETTEYSHFKALEENEIPMVFFDRVCDAVKADHVIIDDYKAAFNAVEHLIAIGRRKIIHFAGPQNLKIGIERLKGYLGALDKYNVPKSDSYIFECDKHEDAINIVNNLIKTNNLPDAIFAVNDSTAIGALVALKRNGIDVPDMVAIAGFTNGLISTVTDPPLTTVDQNGYLMGQRSAEILLDRIENRFTGDYLSEVIPTELKIRGSTIKNFF